MTPDQIFSIVNPLAALAWLLLIVVPRRAAIVTSLVVPLIFAALYAALIAGNWGGHDGGFSTLAEVGRLFANRWLLLAGWVHYLAFDLFIGAWETRDAMARRVPRLLLAPCLVMTFMLGPIGLLGYHLVRARAHQPLDGPILAPVTKAD